jgi:hypothetical protein
MLEFASEIAGKPKEMINLQLNILKLAKAEVTPLSIELEDKRKPKAVSLRGVPQSKLRKLLADIEKIEKKVGG